MNMLRALGRAFGADPDRFEAIVQDYEHRGHSARRAPEPAPWREVVRELLEAYPKPWTTTEEHVLVARATRLLSGPEPAADSCACCDQSATHTGSDGYRRCEEHRLSGAEPEPAYTAALVGEAQRDAFVVGVLEGSTFDREKANEEWIRAWAIKEALRLYPDAGKPAEAGGGGA